MKTDLKSVRRSTEPKDQRLAEAAGPKKDDRPTPVHLNDNGSEWPFVPFLEDWYASC
jgi:hypothetical protein